MNNNNGIKKYISEDQLIYTNDLDLTNEQKSYIKTNSDFSGRKWHYLEEYEIAVSDDSFLYGNDYAFDIESIKTSLDTIHTIITYIEGVLAENAINILVQNLYNTIKTLNDSSSIKNSFYVSFYDNTNIRTFTCVIDEEEYRFSIKGPRCIDGTYDINNNSWTFGTIESIKTTDKTLSMKYIAADAKAVGDALALKADKADIEGAIQNIDLTNYYSKTEIDNMEFITIADIDEICEFELVDASEVSY